MRPGTSILLSALAVAIALIIVGMLLGTSPSRMVFWMLASLAAMAIGLFFYGRSSRR